MLQTKIAEHTKNIRNFQAEIQKYENLKQEEQEKIDELQKQLNALIEDDKVWLILENLKEEPFKLLLCPDETFLDKLRSYPEVTIESYDVTVRFGGSHAVDGDYHVRSKSLEIHLDSYDIIRIGQNYDFCGKDKLIDEEMGIPDAKNAIEKCFTDQMDKLDEDEVMDKFKYEPDSIAEGSWEGCLELYVIKSSKYNPNESGSEDHK